MTEEDEREMLATFLNVKKDVYDLNTLKSMWDKNKSKDNILQSKIAISELQLKDAIMEVEINKELLSNPQNYSNNKETLNKEIAKDYLLNLPKEAKEAREKWESAQSYISGGVIRPNRTRINNLLAISLRDGTLTMQCTICGRIIEFSNWNGNSDFISWNYCSSVDCMNAQLHNKISNTNGV